MSCTASTSSVDVFSPQFAVKAADKAGHDRRCRRTHQLIKLVRLVFLMDVRNRVEEGIPNNPQVRRLLRRRNPEKRQPRRSYPRAKNTEKLMRVLAMLNRPAT